MDAALETALLAQTICPVVLVRIDAPGRTVRLCGGLAEVAFDGGTYTSTDAVYGTIAGISPVQDSIATEERGLSLSLTGVTEAALTALETATPDIRLWLGAINIETGALIGAPELMFTGFVETSDEEVGQGTENVTLNCVSIWYRLLRNNDAQALNHAWHTFAWPGEEGLEYTQGIVTAQPSRYAQTQTTTINAGRFTQLFTALAEQQQ